jgi:tRNA threonylcarbamoyladenosine modification (KEOPS) complex  Pcc1 subunit
MSTRAKATIHLQFPNEKQLTTLLNALSPEAKSPATHRACVKLEKNGLTLVLAVEAQDTVALRATLNAYLRWIRSTVNVMETVENPKPPNIG